MSVKIGVIGLGQRGSGLVKNCLLKIKNAQVVHVCDLYPDRARDMAEIIREKTGAAPRVTCSYEEVLADPEVKAVLVSASWESHAEIAVAALRAGKITAMEVGGAYSVEDCWELVRAYEATKTPFMFLENCCYDKSELLATAMCRKGLFGEIVHCSGAYSHDLRYEIAFGRQNRHYRLRNYIARNCENYPTHELGPIAKILDINRGNRMLSLVSVASKAAGLKQFVSEHKDELDSDVVEADFKQGDIVYTVITCAGGQTITLRLDTTLPGFYDRDLTVRGTRGMYRQTSHSVVIDGVENKLEFWTGAENTANLLNNAVRYEDEYLPPIWKNITSEQLEAGHGGMDGFLLSAFVDCCESGEEMPIDVYDGASWMAISCLTEQSIALGGAPVIIPDFTNGKWLLRKRLDVVTF